MVYGRAGFYLTNYFLSRWMTYLICYIRSGVGCYIDNVCVNHVFYADDLCLMAPCAIALQELLNMCHSYSIIVDLNFNAKKSFCLHLLLDCLSYLYHIYTLTTFLYPILIQLGI